MQLPTISPELTLRLERIWANEQSIRMNGTMNLEGNPCGVAIRRFGRAVACRAAKVPRDPWMNRTVNLTQAGLGFVDEILAFYREAGVQGYLELAPATATAELMQALAKGGAYPCGFHTVTYGWAKVEEPLPTPGVDVHRIGREDLDLFLRTYLKGFSAPVELAQNLRFWYEVPGWHLYLATVDGVPAGSAMLVVEETIGYMASASTVEEFRGRGVQKALLNRRSYDAAQAGCQLVFGQCAFGSISHHNQEVSGLRTAYTKSIWATPAVG